MSVFISFLILSSRLGQYCVLMLRNESSGECRVLHFYFKLQKFTNHTKVTTLIERCAHLNEVNFLSSFLPQQ